MPTSTKASHDQDKTATPNRPWSADLKEKLTNSQSSTIYVPLEDGADQPSDDEIHTLLLDGLHVEYDAVRNALAVREATQDEIDAAQAPPPEVETQPAGTTPATPGASSKVAGVRTED